LKPPLEYQVVPLTLKPPRDYWVVPLMLEPQPDRFDKLVAELLVAKKTDEQVLEAVTLAAAGRLPTAAEKRATLAVIGTSSDKKAAWAALARALVPKAAGDLPAIKPTAPKGK
jgi:hypothetical protein